MIRLSLVPDTNIFIDNLTFLSALVENELDFILKICISKIVISELDNLKNEKIDARRAIEFLYENSDNMNIEIEGRQDDRFIEVDYAKQEPIIPKNNDEMILNYCLSLENPIILTQDKGFILKCKSKNLYNINTAKYNIVDIYNKICSQASLHGGPISTFDNLEKMDNFRLKLSDFVRAVLLHEVGEPIDIYIEDENLDTLCLIILNNFSMFDKFIPKCSKDMLRTFLKFIQASNLNEVIKMLPEMFALFRFSFNTESY